MAQFCLARIRTADAVPRSRLESLATGDEGIVHDDSSM
jgi:hypothetical protein